MITAPILYDVEGDSDDRLHAALGWFGTLAPLGGSGGLLVGAEVAWQRGEAKTRFGEASRYDVEHDLYSLILHAGLARALTPRFHVEVTPFAGLGLLEQDATLRAPAVVATGDDSGTAWQYGIRGGLFETFGNSLQAGLEVRYAVEESSYRTTLSAGSARVHDDGEATNRVLTILLGVGIRL